MQLTFLAVGAGAVHFGAGGIHFFAFKDQSELPIGAVEMGKWLLGRILKGFRAKPRTKGTQMCHGVREGYGSNRDLGQLWGFLN